MANIFSADFDSLTTGTNDVVPPWSEQKTEYPYNGTAVPASGTQSHMEIVTSPTPPEHTKIMQQYIKSDDSVEVRNQVQVYNNSALNALLPSGEFYMRSLRYFPQDMTNIPDYLRIYEGIPFGGALWVGVPVLWFRQPAAGGSLNKLILSFTNGANSGDAFPLSGTVPIGEWFELKIRLKLGSGTSGQVQVWINNESRINQSNLETCYDTASNYSISQDISGQGNSSVTNTIMYTVGFEVDTDDIWPPFGGGSFEAAWVGNSNQ